jgi:hypothetical protein
VGELGGDSGRTAITLAIAAATMALSGVGSEGRLETRLRKGCAFDRIDGERCKTRPPVGMLVLA